MGGTVLRWTCTRASGQGRSLPTRWWRSCRRSGAAAPGPTLSTTPRSGGRWSITRGTSCGPRGKLWAGELGVRSDRAGCSGARRRTAGSGCRGRGTRRSPGTSRSTGSQTGSRTGRCGWVCSRRRSCSRTWATSVSTSWPRPAPTSCRGPRATTGGWRTEPTGYAGPGPSSRRPARDGGVRVLPPEASARHRLRGGAEPGDQL